MTALVRFARALLGHAGPALRGRDVGLWAAGLTFFAVLAVVPTIVLAMRGAAVLLPRDRVVDGAAHWAAALPGEHRAGQALVTATAAALRASWWSLLAAVLTATLYGEGLRRSLNQVARRPATAFTGWAGRLGFLPLLVASPVLVALLLLLGPVVAPLYAAGGWSLVLGVVVVFHLDWVVLSTAVVLVFRFLGPVRLPAPSLVVAGAAVGAVLAGFVQGFVLFLAIPVDWAVPFAGLGAVGAVAAVGLWLYLVHVLLLVGYRLTVSGVAVRGGLHAEPAVRDRREAA